MNKKLIFFFVIMAGLVQYACRKDNNGGGPPTITNIRVVDSTLRDSFFTEAYPGTQIVIQGSNLGGVQAIYFNDTAAFFNPVYNTSSNLIVTIPASAQTKATDPNVQSMIKIVTDHGTIMYPFTLYLPPPYITSISFDNTGKIVTINGGNFQGIQKIVFPTPNKDTALSYTINKTFNQIVAIVPPETPLYDSVRVFCTYGVGVYAYPPPITITNVSNENATGGSTITIQGTNFIAMSSVTFPGGAVSTDITPVSVNEFMVKVPMGITTTGILSVTGALGSATAPQAYASYITHASPGYLCSFDAQYSSDNTGFVGWTGGYADAGTASTNYPGATTGVGVLQQSSPMGPNTSAGSQGNAGLLQLGDFPWVANKADSIDGYSLKFEVYVASPWSGGEIWIAVGDWYGWSSYTARFAPWETAPGNIYQPASWTTITIPLSQFITGNEFYRTAWSTAGHPATTFADYSTTGVGFLIVNDQATAVPTNSINIAIDNVRIVKGQ